MIPDPRSIVTPDAFTVAPDLLGIALARPWRRLAAMGIDGILAAIMAQGGYVLFTAVALMLFLWRALAGPVDRVLPTRLRTVARAVFALLLVAGLVGSWNGISGRLGADDAARAELTALRESAGDGGVVRLARGVADDLGLGFGWFALYFTAFGVLGRGQTPGKWLLGIRIIRLDNRPLGWWLAFERFGGYAASLSTGLLGFAQILWDRNRQALHDKATETVVIRVHRGEPVRLA